MSVYITVNLKSVFVYAIGLCFQVKLTFLFLRTYVHEDAVNSCLCLFKCSLFVFLLVCVCGSVRVFYCEFNLF